MCGRFTLTSSPEELALRFGFDEGQAARAHPAPRYNVAPGQDVLAVRASEEGTARPEALRWGLVPSWASDPAIGNRMINARVETAASKPAFRDALRSRRCLVPADGFYEWADHGGFKQPYYIRAGEAGEATLFAFAALYEQWRDPSGGLLTSCALLTADAAPSIHELHHRMPVAVPPEGYAAWLDPADVDGETRLAQARDEAVRGWWFHPVSERVNKATVDDPLCVEGVPEAPRQESLF